MDQVPWHYAERLEILHEIDRAILEARSPGAIAKAALHHVRRMVPCLGGAVAILHVERSEAIILVAEVSGEVKVPDATHLSLREFRWADELVRALQRGQVHIVEDLRSDASSSQAVRMMLEWGLLALLNVPLVAEGELIGLLCLGAEHPGPFAPEYVDLACEVAQPLAIAIQQAQLCEQVRTGRDRLRQLVRQLVSTQEEERRRLSRALHDEAGQALTALKMSLECVKDDLPIEAERLRRRIADAAALAETTMEQLRRLAHDLRPPAFDAVGLSPALESFCRHFASHTRLVIDYLSAELPALPETVSICLYRFLQEALTNVAKHAHANQVRVVLGCDRHTVHLAVEDDGRGFDHGAALSASGWPMGIGLLDMQERLESLGGQLEMASQPGQGARLVACVPLEEG
jgi:signal transduction histidine kinase